MHYVCTYSVIHHHHHGCIKCVCIHWFIIILMNALRVYVFIHSLSWSWMYYVCMYSFIHHPHHEWLCVYVFSHTSSSWMHYVCMYPLIHNRHHDLNQMIINVCIQPCSYHHHHDCTKCTYSFIHHHHHECTLCVCIHYPLCQQEKSWTWRHFWLAFSLHVCVKYMDVLWGGYD